MNILLRDLKRAGIMTANCTAFGNPDMRALILQRMAGRTIMHMGTDVVPGPYWAVSDADVPGLVKLGYEVNMRVSDIPPEPDTEPPKTTG